MRLLGLLPLLACGACSMDSGPDDVVGPFTGPVHRFVVNRFSLPSNSTLARTLATDLNGDDVPDNQLGNLTGLLASWDDLTTHADDMIASGVLASSVEIQADDLSNDDTVGVTYLGADGAPAEVVGGRIVDGTFHANPLATTHAAGKATLRLPVFIDADPSQIFADALEIELVPDGAGGYDATIRGGTGPDARAVAARGMVQMITADPAEHAGLIHDFDADHDGRLTEEELEANTAFDALVAPDVKLTVDDHQVKVMSLAFAAHLRACASGTCVTDPPQHTCFDRIVDGDETGVDCGGTCHACPAP